MAGSALPDKAILQINSLAHEMHELGIDLGVLESTHGGTTPEPQG
jgi:hypothetical protein